MKVKYSTMGKQNYNAFLYQLKFLHKSMVNNLTITKHKLNIPSESEIYVLVGIAASVINNCRYLQKIMYSVTVRANTITIRTPKKIEQST